MRSIGRAAMPPKRHQSPWGRQFKKALRLIKSEGFFGFRKVGDENPAGVCGARSAERAAEGGGQSPDPATRESQSPWGRQFKTRLPRRVFYWRGEALRLPPSAALEKGAGEYYACEDPEGGRKSKHYFQPSDLNQ